MVMLMRLDNKGFAISTALYGLLTLFIIILMLIFEIMRSGSNNAKQLGDEIQKNLDDTRATRVEIYKSAS